MNRIGIKTQKSCLSSPSLFMSLLILACGSRGGIPSPKSSPSPAHEDPWIKPPRFNPTRHFFSMLFAASICALPCRSKGPVAVILDHRKVHIGEVSAFSGDHAGFCSFHSRTVKRCSSSIRSGSVPLWARIPGMILFRTPIPRASA